MKKLMISLSAVCLAASLAVAQEAEKKEGKGEKAEKAEKGEAKQSHGPVMSASAIKKALLALGLYPEALDNMNLTKDQREKVTALIEKFRPEFENVSKALCSELTGLMTEEQKAAFNRGMQAAQKRINMERGIVPAPR